uniref:Uncharacterized protein n=1 Tax=Rhizophora mucronata TaxID=61149 RepID=A0A2P2R2B5_RHIMU
MCNRNLSWSYLVSSRTEMCLYATVVCNSSSIILQKEH